jgi:hypothetical protein
LAVFCSSFSVVSVLCSAEYSISQRRSSKCLSSFDGPESVFSHGQLYVGFSRNGDPNQVFVHANQDEFMHLQNQLPQDHFFTRNVVYKEIFQ